MFPHLLGFLVIVFTVALATPSLQNQSSLSTSGSDTTATDSPTFGAIIERAVARANQQDEAGVELEYESLIRTTVDSLDGNGNVTDTETTLHKRYGLEGSVYEELLQQNGETLTDQEIEEEQQKRESFVRDVRERARRGEKPETNDERQIRFDRGLVDRFQATLTGVEEIRGELAWVLSFEPRPGKLPEKTRMDKAMNRSTGKLYIAQRDFGLMRIEFELQQPIRYLWGLIATLKHAAGQLEFTRVAPDVWLPHTYGLEIDLRVFFRSQHQLIVREWIERRCREAPAGSGSKPSAAQKPHC